MDSCLRWRAGQFLFKMEAGQLFEMGAGYLFEVGAGQLFEMGDEH